MKKIRNLLAALVFLSLIIFISCGKDDGPAVVDPAVEQAQLLDKVWTVNASSIQYDSGTPDGDWSSFSLTLSGATSTGGSYSASGVPSGFESVWPSSGSWEFNDGDIDEMLRSDGVVMDISNLGDNSMTLSFDIAASGGRAAVSGIAGSWDFTFSAN